MSHKATLWLASLPPGQLTHSEFRVMFHLCDCHNPSHGCFPSQNYLRDNTSLSNGGLNNALLALEEKGLIRREKRHDDDSRKRLSTRYFLAFESDFTVEPTPLSGDGANSTFQGEPSPLFGQSHLHLSGVVYKAEPVKEPVKEPVTCEASLFGDIPKQVAPFGGQTIEAMFDRFWKVYPKKVGKPAAFKNFAKAIAAGADPERIIEAAGRYAQWLTSGKRGEFRPHAKFPQGWLTEQRWEDPDIWQDDEIDPHRARLREITRQAQAAERRAN